MLYKEKKPQQPPPKQANKHNSRKHWHKPNQKTIKQNKQKHQSPKTLKKPQPNKHPNKTSKKLRKLKACVQIQMFVWGDKQLCAGYCDS